MNRTNFNAYRSAINEALELGVRRRHIAEAVSALVGDEDLDPDVLRAALRQYVPIEVTREHMLAPQSPAPSSFELAEAGLSSFPINEAAAGT